jgi:hypothetical protein
MQIPGWGCLLASDPKQRYASMVWLLTPISHQMMVIKFSNASPNWLISYQKKNLCMVIMNELLEIPSYLISITFILF